MKKKSELEKKIEALPPCPKKAYKWTLEEDAVLLKYAEEKGINAISKAMGISFMSVRRRYEVLKAKMGK
jgi:hypothetical protein